eukprot:2859625-Pleurochrysis_carterae.AAC.1
MADLPSFLQSLSNASITRSRKALTRVRGAFAWRGDGALAYNYTLLSLCHRLAELRGTVPGGGGGGVDCGSLASRLPNANAQRRVPAWFPQPLTEATRHVAAQRTKCYWDPRAVGC